MNNIRKIREEIGMKQVELSILTGLSRGYLSHLENGNRNNPSYKTMEKISNALKKNVSEIFY